MCTCYPCSLSVLSRYDLVTWTLRQEANPSLATKSTRYYVSLGVHTHKSRCIALTTGHLTTISSINKTCSYSFDLLCLKSGLVQPKNSVRPDLTNIGHEFIAYRGHVRSFPISTDRTINWYNPPLNCISTLINGRKMTHCENKYFMTVRVVK